MLLKRHRTHPDRDYKAELTAMSFLTLDDVEEAMKSVPLLVLSKLKEGPHPNRYSCGVCEAFDEMFEGYDITIDTNDPIYRIWVYHEIPKANFTHADQNYYGAGANEIYDRCITTYRLAGWEGTAYPADA